MVDNVDVIMKRAFSGRAVLLPLCKEIENMLKFSNILTCKPVGVYPIVGSSINNNNIKIYADLNDLSQADFIIAGYLEKISRCLNRDFLETILNIALKQNKHVFSFDDINIPRYSDLLTRAKEQNLIFYTPQIYPTQDMIYNKSTDRIKWKRNIMIAGTGSNQGKFTVFLKICEELRRRNILFKSMGSEHHAYFFGVDSVFPYGKSNSINASVQKWPSYLQYELSRIYEKEAILLSVSQAGVIQYAITKDVSKVQSVCSSSFIFGINPESVILVINPHIDKKKYIHDTITYLKIIHNVKVVCLTFSDRVIGTKENRLLTMADINNFKHDLELEYGLSTFCIGNNDDIASIVDKIMM